METTVVDEVTIPLSDLLKELNANVGRSVKFTGEWDDDAEILTFLRNSGYAADILDDGEKVTLCMTPDVDPDTRVILDAIPNEVDIVHPGQYVIELIDKKKRLIGLVPVHHEETP